MSKVEKQIAEGICSVENIKNKEMIFWIIWSTLSIICGVFLSSYLFLGIPVVIIRVMVEAGEIIKTLSP